jgi:predicted ATP-binding protein involved in virulence
VPFKEIDFTLDNSRKIYVAKKVEDSVRITENGAVRVTERGKIRMVSTTKLCFKLIFEDAVSEIFEFPGMKSEEKQSRVLKLLENIKVYLIKDQRLTCSAVTQHGGTTILNQIDLLSKNLVKIISQKKAKEDEKSKALDASYAERLFEYKKAIPKSDFEKRHEDLTKKYQLLQRYKIYKNHLAKAEYVGENQRALSIYLEDWEKKVAVYDELLDKIALFLSIMNSKCLANKTFTVNAKEGFCFTTIDGKPLQLSDLSSGEQHQTILLYELLFNAPPDSLVLIDEPEASMHVAWQIEFLRDIEKIAKLSGLSFIIATHSPDLINDSPSVDLYELMHGNAEEDDE